MQEPQPQLAELLRTCLHPPSLLLQITHIDFLDFKDRAQSPSKPHHGDFSESSNETHRYAVKLILSDGEIMMQALLHRKLIGLRDVADVVVGDLLDIRRFALKKSPRSGGQGHVVYLAIEDCHFLQRIQAPPNSALKVEEIAYTESSRKRKRTNSHSDIVATEVVACVNRSAKTDKMHNLIGLATVPKPLLHHAFDQTTAGDLPGIDEPQAQIGKSHQSVSMDARNTISRGKPLPPVSGQLSTQFNEEMDERELAKGEYDKRERQNTLKNTFGARQIIFDEEEDDFFEALPTDQTRVKKRRKVLQRLDINASFSSQTLLQPEDREENNDQITPSNPPKLEVRAPDEISTTVKPSQAFPPPRHPLPKMSVRDGTFALSQTPTFHKPQPQAPSAVTANVQPPARHAQTQPTPQPMQSPALLPSPPFHTLSSLRHPQASQSIPAKSYTLTTLAVISWTGTTTIHRAGSLFPPKRHLKIVDPSLATSQPPSRQVQGRQPVRDLHPSSLKAQNSFQDAVTVAVYIDATNFKPVPGTLVLFRGLVMQRLVNGDIILNAYGRLKEQRFEEVIDKTEEQTEASTNQVAVIKDQDSGNPGLHDHWFITDHSRIRNLGYGSRLDYYLDWWVEKQRPQQNPPVET